MRYGKKDILSVITFVLGSSLCIYTFYVLYNGGRSVLDAVPVVGSIASFFGLIIAILQIANVRSSSEAAKKAAEDARSDVYNFVSLSDVSSAIKMLDEVKNHLRDENYIAAEIRMGDLRGKMTKIKDHDKMGAVQRSEEFDSIVEDMGMELSNLNKTIMNSQKNYDRVSVMKKMEEAKDIMLELESEIKFNNNDPSR